MVRTARSAVRRNTDRSQGQPIGGPAPASLDVGDELHDARLTRGETLEQASHFTQIRLPYLRALEHDDASVFEPFPGMTYARYFLRDYAEHLGIDPRPLVRRFDREVSTPTVLPVGSDGTAAACTASRTVGGRRARPADRRLGRERPLVGASRRRPDRPRATLRDHGGPRAEPGGPATVAAERVGTALRPRRSWPPSGRPIGPRGSWWR